jgi:hypothetical protein
LHPPDEARIETDRIRGEHPSALADEQQPLVGEQLVEPFETTPHKGEIERARIQEEQGESFQTMQHSHDLADESTPVAADRLDEQREQEIGFNKAGVIRPTDEQIARRAYELYLNRGQAPGHGVEDWLQAERELFENWRQ